MKLKIRALQNYTLFKMLTSKGQYQVIKKKENLGVRKYDNYNNILN